MCCTLSQCIWWNFYHKELMKLMSHYLEMNFVFHFWWTVYYMPSCYNPYWCGRCNNTANTVHNVSARCFLDVVFKSYCNLTWHLDTQLWRHYKLSLMLFPSHELSHDDKLQNGPWFYKLNFCREAGMKYCLNCKSLEFFNRFSWRFLSFGLCCFVVGNNLINIILKSLLPRSPI